MIEAKEIERLGRVKEKENLRFREYLKMRADNELLDEQFKALHEKYFNSFDCSKCGNCCKMCEVIVTEEEINDICNYLEMDRNVFIRKFIRDDYNDNEYKFKHKYCDFLSSKNDCLLEGAKPKCCVDYPYTDKKDRLFSLYSIIDNAKVCPVVYQILEELKDIYNFKG